MTSRPAVSGIIIVYNGEEFLDDAIASVRSQTFTDWELLVVDDGSTDATREITRRHSDADPRIRALRHHDEGNHGMSATRNRGLSEARGEYVGFLDADDVWLPDKLDQQLAIFGAHPEVAMVYGRTLIWHFPPTPSVVKDFFYDLGVEPDRVHHPPVLFRNLLRNVYQTPTTCSALMRRSALESVGGFDESFRSTFEDQICFAKLELEFPVYVSDTCWARYRQHDRSSCGVSTPHARDHLVHVRYLRAVRRHLRQTGRDRVIDRLAVERKILKLRARRSLSRVVGQFSRRRPR